MIKEPECTKENVGKTHPLYGGYLTDLMELPVGTHFYVTNGAWAGVIALNQNDEKCVLPVGADPESAVPITESYRYSLWLERIQTPNCVVIDAQIEHLAIDLLKACCTDDDIFAIWNKIKNRVIALATETYNAKTMRTGIKQEDVMPAISKALIESMDSGISQMPEHTNLTMTPIAFAGKMQQLVLSLYEDIQDSESETDAWIKIGKCCNELYSMWNGHKRAESEPLAVLEDDVPGHTDYLQGVSLPIFVNSIIEDGQLEPSEVSEMHVGEVDGTTCLLITPEIVG